MPRTEIVHDDPVLRLGVSRNLLVPTWYGPPESAQLRALARGTLAVSNRYDGDVGVFDVVVSGTPRFGDEVREELVKILRDPRLRGRASAHVILLGGLAGVATRSFLSTVLLVSRSSVPNKVFGEPRSAAAWLAPLLTRETREAWTTEQILAAQIDVMRPAPTATR